MIHHQGESCKMITSIFFVEIQLHSTVQNDMDFSSSDSNQQN